MPRYAAFLRAINVGRSRTVRMVTIRKALEELGFSEVKSFIASGNILFETRSRGAAALERKIGQALRERLGYEVNVFIRTKAQMARIVRLKPFPQSEINRAAELNIVFLSDTLPPETRQKLTALKSSTDQFTVRGRELYWLRRKKRNGHGFSTAPLDKIIGEPFTIRSARTVKAIFEEYFAVQS